MDDQTKQAFQSTSDSFKQIITLSTGVLTLEITLLKDVIKDLPWFAYVSLGISWVLFLVALVAGVWGMLALTGTLAKLQQLQPGSVYNGNIAKPATVQVVCFAFGMLCTVLFGLSMLAVKASA